MDVAVRMRPKRAVWYNTASVGFCVWLTGLSGAGKSTTAAALLRLLEESGIAVRLLDGDAVRRQFSPALGFTRQDRDANVRRMGHAASELLPQGYAVIVAAISPYRETREEVRGVIGPERFVEVFVNTPLEECERRDPKGLYAKARSGEVTRLTGVDDPYEPPLAPDIELDTVTRGAEQNARMIHDHLRGRGWIGK